MSGRILGLDPGQKRIGVAVSDTSCTIASPVEYVDRGDADYGRRLKDICDEWQISEIVVGLALSLDGSEGHAAAQSRELGGVVGALTGLPVSYQDERFTTVTADQALLEGGVRRQKRKHVRDQVAAAVMLQGHLDARRYQSEQQREPDD